MPLGHTTGNAATGVFVIIHLAGQTCKNTPYSLKKNTVKMMSYCLNELLYYGYYSFNYKYLSIVLMYTRKGPAQARV